LPGDGEGEPGYDEENPWDAEEQIEADIRGAIVSGAKRPVGDAVGGAQHGEEDGDGEDKQCARLLLNVERPAKHAWARNDRLLGGVASINRRRLPPDDNAGDRPPPVSSTDARLHWYAIPRRRIEKATSSVSDRLPETNPTQSELHASARARQQSRRKGLGRGLGALIPTMPEGIGSATHEVDISQIEPNPYQPRTEIDGGKLEALVDSIRTHGVIQPLVVKQSVDETRFVLIAGERRWRAARLAGLRTVPIVIKEAAPQAMLELALVENVVRADLSPLEEAAAYRQLVDEFGLTQADVAARVGRSRVSVTNTLRLLSAPEGVQAALTVGQITEGHARALLGLPSAADQLAMLDAVIARDWTVRQTEEAVRRWQSERSQRRPTNTARAVDDDRLQDRLRSALGTKVAFRRDARGGGSITIHFYSDEELQSLVERVAGEELW
jgi:ParB family chromosome partitioning protein